MVRSVRVAGGAEVAHNLDQFEVNRLVHERDLKRRKRSGERAAEWDDVDERDVFVSRHENGRESSSNALIPPEFFNKMAQALADAMGPMASLVLRDRIAALGEAVEEFPIARLPELVAAIKQEILSEALRMRFEEQIAAQVQEHSKAAFWRASSK
jgi:hypothetical protein